MRNNQVICILDEMIDCNLLEIYWMNFLGLESIDAVHLNENCSLLCVVRFVGLHLNAFCDGYVNDDGCDQKFGSIEEFAAECYFEVAGVMIQRVDSHQHSNKESTKYMSETTYLKYCSIIRDKNAWALA